MRGDAFKPAAVPDADIVRVEILQFPVDHLAEQTHQSADFDGWTRPVLGGEGIECENLDAELGCRSQDGADVLGAGPMSRHPGQPRACAQRPFPSMTMPTWCGTRVMPGYRSLRVRSCVTKASRCP